MKRLFCLLCLALILNGCKNDNVEISNENSSVYYEIFVRSFYDTNDDGLGDLNGVRAKLDYLEELGVGGIWLMPIMPSTTYHKYDVKDYMDIDSEYGTLEDFKNLVTEAKTHHIDIIIDLVVNHTSAQHPWFLDARSHVLSDTCDQTKYCDYYHFTSERTSGSVPLGNKYYEAVFWDQMPDLNLDNPEVRNEIEKIVEFWLNLGVKGFRLDAATHYYEGNNEKNIEFLSWLNSVVKEKKADAYLVGEAWTNQQIVHDYYQSGIDSFFNFSLGTENGNIIKAIRKADGASLALSIEKNQKEILAMNEKGIDAPFLSNHDNARSFNYFSSDEQVKLAESIYLLLPGHPFIYYGEEIGLKGSGKDENKRLAFLWGEDEGKCLNPSGMDYASPSLYTLKEAQKDSNSLYHTILEVMQIRNQHDFLHARVTALDVGNSNIMLMKMENDEETFYVIHNLGKETITFEYEEFNEILHQLSPSSQKSTLKGQTLTIPSYASVVCK